MYSNWAVNFSQFEYIWVDVKPKMYHNFTHCQFSWQLAHIVRLFVFIRHLWCSIPSPFDIVPWRALNSNIWRDFGTWKWKTNAILLLLCISICTMNRSISILVLIVCGFVVIIAVVVCILLLLWKCPKFYLVDWSLFTLTPNVITKNWTADAGNFRHCNEWTSCEKSNKNSSTHLSQTVNHIWHKCHNKN